MPENIRRVVRDRKLTPEEAEHYRQLRAKLDAEAPEIKKLARALRDRPRGVPLTNIVEALKHEREKQGISLDDLGQRAGIATELLTAIENDPQSDPTINVVLRYASALGKTVELMMVP